MSTKDVSLDIKKTSALVVENLYYWGVHTPKTGRVVLTVSLAAIIMTVGSDNRKHKRKHDQSIEFICYCPLLEARQSLRARAHDISIYFRLTHSGRSDSDVDTLSRDPPGATETA